MRKTDPHYAALQLEQARLHLGSVMAGQDSEPFFCAMLYLIEVNAHYGYVTLRNKQVELKGIKDFLHSVYYGLGIKEEYMNDFLLNVVKSAIKEKSKNRYAHQFIEWLRRQDPRFEFPQEYFEFVRVMKYVASNRKTPKRTKYLEWDSAKFMYKMYPHLLEQIGPGKKYRTVQDCYLGEGLEEKRESLKPIKTYRNPTRHQISELSAALIARIGPGRSRVLVSELLSQIGDLEQQPERQDDESGACPRPGHDDGLGA